MRIVLTNLIALFTVVNGRASFEAGELSDRKDELNEHIAALERGTADVRVLKKLALLCIASPVNEPISPISPNLSGPLSPSAQFGHSHSLLSLKSDLWEQDKVFERFFSALIQYLDPARVSHLCTTYWYRHIADMPPYLVMFAVLMITQDTNELEYALIVLWELLEHQAPLLEGREAEIFSALLRVRFSAHVSVRVLFF